MAEITLYDLKNNNIIDFARYDFADKEIDSTLYMIPNKNDDLLKKITVCKITKDYITCDFYSFIIKNKKTVIDNIKQQGYIDEDFERRYINGIRNNDPEYFYIYISNDIQTLFEEY